MAGRDSFISQNGDFSGVFPYSPNEFRACHLEIHCHEFKQHQLSCKNLSGWFPGFYASIQQVECVFPGLTEIHHILHVISQFSVSQFSCHLPCPVFRCVLARVYFVCMNDNSMSRILFLFLTGFMVCLVFTG